MGKYHLEHIYIFTDLKTEIGRMFFKNKIVICTNIIDNFSILASLNLPAAIENVSGNELPPSLIAKGDTIKREGGINMLQKTFSELPDLLQRNRDILDEV